MKPKRLVINELLDLDCRKNRFSKRNSCDLSPIKTAVMILIAMFVFCVFECLFETLIFGESFDHWLDPIFIMFFVFWASHATHVCAVLKEGNEQNLD